MRFVSAAALALVVAFCGLSDPVGAALTVNGYTPATAGNYDRFLDSPGFIGNAFDWSGVGRTTSGRWGVLISPSFIISAAHLPPVAGTSIRFYETNNSGGAFVDRIVGTSVTLTQTGFGVGSDLVLTQLNAPATGIATYAIANPVSPASLVGSELYVWGQAGTPNAQTSMRLGRNEVTDVALGFSSPSLGVSTGDVFVYDYDTTGTGLGPDEAKIEDFDSGAPSFIITSGGPAIVGIHWFKYGVDPLVPGSLPGSGDTLVTSFINELNLAMAATGSLERVTVAVPEPSAGVLWAMGLSLLASRRRRNEVSGKR